MLDEINIETPLAIEEEKESIESISNSDDDEALIMQAIQNEISIADDSIGSDEMNVIAEIMQSD